MNEFEFECDYVGDEISDPEILAKLSESHRSLLEQVNGFILFGGGLHIRGACYEPDWHSLRKVWFGDFALHKLFSAVDEKDAPFAQDCLGDQFILRDEVVHRLSSEDGDLESLELDLMAFLQKAQDEPIDFLQLHPLLQFHEEGGELSPGQLLNVYPPFFTEESAKGVSLRAIPMFEQLSFLADLSKQIAGLPEGAKIKFTVINHPDENR